MLPAKPAWLDDEPEIRDWLNEVLDRLDSQPAEERSAPLRFPVSEQRFPSLFQQRGPEADARWELIKSLRAALALTIVPKRKTNPFAAEYEGARLDLGVASEASVRAWLRRPRGGPETEAWQAAVDEAAVDWPEDARARLRHRPVTVPGRSPHEVVGALVRLGELRNRPLTLRQLSARTFFGDSKFLEQREALLRGLYPDFSPAPRPLLVAVALTEAIEGVLFIENHDTYIRAVAGQYAETAGLALVYAAGFKGSATRIRDRHGALLHYARAGGAQQDFEQWWFRESPATWPVSFWGDLDFEAMRILKGLREQFGAGAWQPGYEPLVSMLRAGLGHAPEAADKANQKPAEPTGCTYADQTLLPLLLTGRRFVDQEAW